MPATTTSLPVSEIKLGVDADPAHATTWMTNLQNALVKRFKEKHGITATVKCSVGAANTVKFEVTVTEMDANNVKKVIKTT